jgi:hypothetical protein
MSDDAVPDLGLVSGGGGVTVERIVHPFSSNLAASATESIAAFRFISVLKRSMPFQKVESFLREVQQKP